MSKEISDEIIARLRAYNVQVSKKVNERGLSECLKDIEELRTSIYETYEMYRSSRPEVARTCIEMDQYWIGKESSVLGEIKLYPYEETLPAFLIQNK